MKRFLILTSLVLFCSFAFPNVAYAACSWNGNTGTVASPYAASDVQACINDAAGKTGDVVIQIPDCTVTHTQAITVDHSSGWVNVNSLTITGQNRCAVDGNDRPTSCGTNIAGFSLTYKGKQGKDFRLAHMHLPTPAQRNSNSAIYIDGNGKSWRFDHLLFDTLSSPGSGYIFYIYRSASFVNDTTYGLIDSSKFIHTYPGTGGTGLTVIMYFPLYDGGNTEWVNPLNLGTAEAIYFENNIFHADSGMFSISDTNSGGRFVFRYSDFDDSFLGAHDAIVTGGRGVRKWEVYNNIWNYNANGNCFVAYMRSGTGVFFNNTINDPSLVLCQDGVKLVETRNYQTGGNPWTGLCSSSTGKACLGSGLIYPQSCTTDANCGGISGSCIDIDGTGSPDGYLCRDQAGSDGNNPQVSRPFLFWNNTRNGNPITVSIDSHSTNYIVLNRDYCVSATSMPTSCNGVSTNYIPYTYPHPLTKGIINAASCSQQAVQAAINSAGNGDTVAVPAGSCTWSSGIWIPNSKKITLQGAGKASTVITMSPRGTVFGLGNSGSRLTGFGFVEGMVYSNGNGFRIDHCSFSFSSWADAIIAGTRDDASPSPAAGLVDNNDFLRSRVGSMGTNCMFTDICGNAQHVLWAVPANLGDANAIYIENNTFTSDVFGNAVDCNYAGRYVFRFNTIINSGAGGNSGFYIESHSVQGLNRACQRWEVYGNTLINNGGLIYEPFRHRGGTGVSFDNSVQGTWTNYEIALDNVRSRTDEGTFLQGSCNGNSNWDENLPGQTGYACRDQIGIGYDAVQWAVGNAWNQVKMPVYAWNNKKSDGITEVPFVQVGNDIGNPIQANRDYYNYMASFSGASGMGVGILANRPSTCTTGVAYWATDVGEWNSNKPGPDGQLYKCNTTNTWTLYYTPYTYPHPLTLSGNPQTCSGTCCLPSQVCSGGSFQSSTDCGSLCCVGGGTCQANPCGNGSCDSGECSTCPQDCSLSQCCGRDGCNPQIGETCSSCLGDCPCTSGNCCSGSCQTPACSQASDCGSNPCLTYTCNNPGTCSASCSSVPKTSCVNSDGCCPSGCTNQNDSDCPLLCTGLVMLHHYDSNSAYGESPTNIYDFSKNGNNGTATGATWSSSGKFSGAFTYDGTNDLINVSIPSSSTLDIDSNPVTMVAWIKPNSVSTQQAVIARGLSDGISAGNNGFGFWINASGKINVGSFGGGNFDGNTTLSTNTWYHVAVVINGASSSLYLNGADNTPASHTVNVVASDKPLKIGASRNLTDTADMRFFNGSIDELAIWNRSLSSQEIQNLYSSTSPISCQTCIHKSDNNPCDGKVCMTELLAFISRWNINNQDVNIRELIVAIGLYNKNKGC